MTQAGAPGVDARALAAEQPDAAPLAGVRVLVTRPQAQSESLGEAIRTHGGEPLSLPVIVIEGLDDTAELDGALVACADFDLLVFVSANAVEQTFARLRALGVAPASVRGAGAPGPGTAAALRSLGIARVIEPASRFDSEGLAAAIEAAGLATPRVLILRGQDTDAPTGEGSGRDWLPDWFRSRGDHVTIRACYRRSRVRREALERSGLLRTPGPDAVVITSSEGATALYDLLGDDGRRWIGDAPMFAPHARIVERIRALGWRHAKLTPGGDAGVVRGLTDHFARVGHG
jgi:uroporphyrinogen-III synthase